MKEELQQEYTERMAQRGIKVTALRLLIFHGLHQASRPLSIHELEDVLQTVDKSTIFRTLTLFLAHDLIHSIEDGSGTVRYEVCPGACHCSVADMHIHFFCVRCHRTFCFKDMPVPQVMVPEGFLMQGINYMIKGLCPHCAEQQQKSL